MEDNKTRVLYDRLTQDGYDIGDFDSFSKNVQDEAKRKSLYETITNDGYDVGDFDSFSSKLVARSQEEPVTNVTTQNVQPEQPQVQPVQDMPSYDPKTQGYILENIPDMFRSKGNNLATRPLPQQDLFENNPSDLVRKIGIDQQQRVEQAQKSANDPYMKEQNLELFKRQNQEQINSVNELINAARQERAKERQQRVRSVGDGGIFSTMSQAYLAGEQNDTDKQLEYASTLMEQAQNITDEAKKKGNTNFFAGFARGFKDAPLDGWAMGLQDLKNYSAAKKVMDKVDKGEELTPSEDALMQALVTNAATQMYYAGDLGRGYKAGGVTAESLPFMLDMIAGMGAVQALTKPASKAIVKYAADKAAQMGLGRATTGLAKGAARTVAGLGDVAAHTATFGSARVAADYQRRGLGDVQVKPNADGTVSYDGRENVQTGAEAFGKSIISTAAETGSELLGEYFAPMLGYIGRVTGANKVGKIIPASVGKAFKDVVNSQGFREMQEIARRAKISDPLGEYAEEVANNLVSTAIGDMTPEQLVDLDQNIDTFLGVAPMSALFGAAGTGGYLRDKYKNYRNMRKFEAQMQDAMGEDWSGVREALQDADIETARNMVKDVLSSPMSPDMKKNAIKYISSVLQEQTLQEADKQMMPEEIAVEKRNIINNLNETRSKISLNDEELNAIINSEEGYQAIISQFDPETANNIMQYKQAYDDFVNYNYWVQDQADNARRQAEAQVESLTNATTGTIMRVNSGLSTNPVNILRGNLVFDNEGKVDENQSDKTIYYMSEDGRVKMAPVSMFSSLVDNTPAEEMIQRAGNDAQEEVLQAEEAQINSIPAQEQQPIGPETRFTMGGNNYEVNRLTPDGYEVYLLDENGTPAQSQLMSEEEIRNAINGQQPANAEETQPSVTEQTVQEETSEQPVQENQTAMSRIPLNERGEQDFESAPVADTSAALLEISDNVDDAKDTATQMIDHYNNELKKAEKAKSTGNTIQEIVKMKQEKKANIKAINDKISYWNQVAADLEAKRPTGLIAQAEEKAKENQQRLASMTAEEQQAAQQEVQKKIDAGAFERKEPRKKVRYVKEDADLGPSITPQEHVLREIATGRVSFSLSDTEGAQGLSSHLGYSNSPEERKKLVWALSSDGLTPEAAAEQIHADMPENLQGMVTDQDVFNMIINAFQEYGSPSKMWDAAKNMHGTDIEENIPGYEEDQERQLIEWEASENRMSVPEWIAYSDYIEEELNNLYSSVTDEELNTIFEQIINDYERRAETESTGSTEGQTDSEQGNTVQPERESDNEGRTGEVEEQPEPANKTDGESSSVVPEPEGTVDNNGYPFLKSSNETTIFGEIREETGLTPAPIKLSEGFNRKDKKGRNHGYGFKHIEESHGDQIRNYGFESIPEFVESVAKNYTIVRKGNKRNGIDTYILEVSDKKNNTLFVELSKDGSYWNVNSAGVFRKGYSKKKEVVWPLPAVEDASTAEDTGVQNAADSSNSISGNSPQNASFIDKDTQYLEEKQEDKRKFTVSEINQGEGVIEYAQRIAKEKEIWDESQKVNINPTEAQKEAGNYKMGHVKVDGIDITIENPKGSVRSGKDANGKEWSVTMNNTYGYIRGTRGVDGDHIDIFLSDNPESGNVYVIDQVDQQTGMYDESKVMYGFNSIEEARDAYLSNYEKGWKVGVISEVSKEEFKKWIESSINKIKPFSEYKNIDVISVENDGSAKDIDPVNEETASYEVRIVSPNVLPKKLRKAYESGNEKDISNTEKELMSFIESTDDVKMIYNTYFYSKDLLGKKDILSPSGEKMHSFIVESCKEVLEKKGIPSQALSNEKSRIKVAERTDNASVLGMMSYDNSQNVVRAVINNPNTSESILRQIIERFSNNGLDFEAKQILDKRKEASNTQPKENIVPISKIGTTTNEEKTLRFRETDVNYSDFAKNHNLNESDVKKYAQSMRNGNLGGASYAFKSIHRSVRLQNDNLSLGQFAKVFSPIKKELYDTFGNLDSLREEYIQREIEERNMMEAAKKRIEEEKIESERLLEFENMSDQEMDEAYFKALENKDKSRMRDIVNESARRKGCISADEFRMSHRAPSYDEEGIDKSMIDVANNKDNIRDSLNEQMRMNRDKNRDESVSAINTALSSIEKEGKATVTVYRAVPKSIKERNVRNGDWVTLSESYAKQHGNHALEGNYRIIKEEVPAENLYWDGNDINEWGYDDRNDYRYKDTKNNRKLNDLVTRDDNGNIIPPSKRFNSRKKDTRFRFIGEQGAANIDAAEEANTRLDNLAVAREMEKSGKGAKTIKIATGWERGADGKWRYEEEDFEYIPKGNAREKSLLEREAWHKELMFLSDKIYNGEKLTDEEEVRFDELSEKEKELKENLKKSDRKFLDDYVSDDSLFKEYPELKQVKVEFYDGSFFDGGSYSHHDMTIRINNNSPLDAKSILVHEVQHAIQYIEGFSKGGNSRTYRNYLNSLKEKRDAWSMIDEFEEKSKELGSDASQMDVYKAVRDEYTSLGMTFGDGIMPSRDAFDKGFNLWVRGYDKEGYEDAYKEYQNLIEKFGLGESKDRYHELSGEVEARNVQSRLNMTPEERRKTLASETEDVSREDQIFLYDSMGANSMTIDENQDLNNIKSEDVEETAKKLNVPVEVITSVDQIKDNSVRSAIEKGRKVKGWYSLSDNKVYVYLPNATSMEDVNQTILHEGVAHYGLRQLVGEDRMDDFLDDVFANVTDEVRKKIIDTLPRYGYNSRIATEEYMARMAENGVEVSVWQRIKQAFNSLMIRMSINIKISDNELRYILWRSRQNLDKNKPLDLAKDVAMQYHMGVGNYFREVDQTPEQSIIDAWDNIASSTMFSLRESMVDYLTAIDKFQDLISKRTGEEIKSFENAYDSMTFLSSKNRVEMDWFDSNIVSPMKKAILKLVGKQNSRKWDWNKGVLRQLVMYVEAKHGVERNRQMAIEKYIKELKPESLKFFENAGISIDRDKYKEDLKKAKKEVGKKAYDKSFQSIYDKLINEGLQKEEAESQAKKRAKVIADRAKSNASEKFRNDFRDKLMKEYSEKVMSDWNDTKKRISKQKDISWIEKQRELDREASRIGADLSQDYSGLSSVFGDEKEYPDGWYESSLNFVEEYENNHNETSIGDLWKSISQATDYTLNKQYESGLVSREYVDRQKQRFENYIPLRGFQDEIAGDVYNYIGNDFYPGSNPVKSAKGRTSEAGNPFGSILNTGYSTISVGNKNLAKMSLYSLVNNHDTEGLAVSNRAWMVRYDKLMQDDDLMEALVIPSLEAGEDIPEWVEAVPKYPEGDISSEEVSRILGRFEDLMKKNSKEGYAKPISKRSRIAYRTLYKERSEHEIPLYILGDKYVITITGNPRVAQAMNGLLNPNVNNKGWAEIGERMQRFMAGAFTAKNAAFSIANLTKDSMYANNQVFIKENIPYWIKFTKKQKAGFGDFIPMMMRLKKYRDGNLDLSDETNKMFKEFMDNGGATGYTFVDTQEKYAKELADKLKELSKSKFKVADPRKLITAFFDSVEFTGQAAELVNRFAAYQTSRDMGRSVTRSIRDAKEITVNFNRKGAGMKSWDDKKSLFDVTNMAAFFSQYGRAYILFWNANMQAKYRFYKNIKEHPIKTSTTLIGNSMMFASVLVPFMNNFVLPALYEMFGIGSGDDDEDYYNTLTDWERTHNICIRLPYGNWLKIPLSPEMSPWYTIGDCIGGAIAGQRELSASDFIKSGIDAISPLSINWSYEGANVILNVLPTISQPVAQVAMNVNFMGNPIKKQPFTMRQGFAPQYTMVYGNTSPALIELSRLSNKLTGGTDSKTSGPLDWNPALWQNVITGYTGGYGSFFLSAADWIVSTSKGEEQSSTIGKMPLVSRFFISGNKDVKIRRINSSFYDVIKFTEEFKFDQKSIENQMNNSLKEGNKEEYMKSKKQLEELLKSDRAKKYIQLDNIVNSTKDFEKYLKEMPDDETTQGMLYQLKSKGLEILKK